MQLQASNRPASEVVHKLKAWLSRSEDKPNGHLSAHMPPNEIYYDAGFFREENRPGGVLRKFWTYVGHASQFASPAGEGKYITATLGHNLPIIVTQAPGGALRGFVNICRHRAAVLLPRAPAEDRGGCGRFGRRIACPYHGWEYAPDGRLAKAVQMGGVERFAARDAALLPVQVGRIGHLIFARAAPEPLGAGGGGDALGGGGGGGGGGDEALDTVDGAFAGLRELVEAAAAGAGGGGGGEGGFEFVARHAYDVECNWKVFADNYLDGGWPPPSLGPSLSLSLSLSLCRSHTLSLSHTRTQPRSCARSQSPTHSLAVNYLDDGWATTPPPTNSLTHSLRPSVPLSYPSLSHSPPSLLLAQPPSRLSNPTLTASHLSMGSIKDGWRSDFIAHTPALSCSRTSSLSLSLSLSIFLSLFLSLTHSLTLTHSLSLPPSLPLCLTPTPPSPCLSLSPKGSRAPSSPVGVSPH